MNEHVSPRRREIVDALRRGTVPPSRVSHLLAVGLDRLAPALDDELHAVAGGGSQFKAVRGEYGGGKTFFARCLAERSQAPRLRGLEGPDLRDRDPAAPSWRRSTDGCVEPLPTAACPQRASARGRTPCCASMEWAYALFETMSYRSTARGRPDRAVCRRRRAHGEPDCDSVSPTSPAFAPPLRATAAAVAAGDGPLADGVLAWLGGQPHVAAAVKRAAGIKGEVDHTARWASCRACW